MTMTKGFKEWRELLEPVEDFKKWALRESKRKEYYNCIEYEDFKKLLEELFKKYNDVIKDYSIDINDIIYIRCDLEIEQQNRLKNFYTEFRNLLKKEYYYIMR